MGRIFVESKIQILDLRFDFKIHLWGEDLDFDSNSSQRGFLPTSDPKINNKTTLHFFKCFIPRIVINVDTYLLHPKVTLNEWIFFALFRNRCNMLDG